MTAADVVVSVPGSKSLTNRALVCAALAAGTSTVRGALVADDSAAMLDCVRHLGAGVDVRHDGDMQVTGMGGALPPGPLDLDARQSGTTSRFLLPVLALGEGPYRLDGAPPLRRRPMGPLFRALRDLGANVAPEAQPGFLPVVVSGPVEGGEVRVSADITSQFISGLLLAGPCMQEGLVLELEGEIVSAPYLAMTAAVMQAFGAPVEGEQVHPGGYTATEYTVEPDASAAAYFLAAAALTGRRVTVQGLHRDSLQGDIGFADLLAKMGADVGDDEDGLWVRGTGELRGVDVDLRDMPDMALTLAATAVFAEGPTRVRGVGFIRGHETDRIAAVVRELRRCGIEAEEHDDGFTVVPGSPRPATVETYDDHRMAMSFALLGLRADGIAIADPDCVTKTFPGFWQTFAPLRDQ